MQQEFNYDKLMQKQRAFFESGETQKSTFRIDSLKKLEKVLKTRESDIFAALKQDLGRCDFESYLSEIGYLHAEIKHTQQNLNDWMAPRPQPTSLALAVSSSYVLPVPLGQILIISPWNYPFQLALAPMVSAIAAGNTVVLKPSELTPATGIVLVDIIASIFPEEYVAVVLGGVPETTALLNLKWNHIFFTGSTQVGKVVAAAAAKNLVPTTLELGGKSPCIVHKDAPLKISARRIAWGKFFNCGQTCVAPDYLLVHKGIKEQFIQELVSVIKEFYGEDPRKSSDYGRIVNAHHLRRLKNLLDGQKVILGGESDLEDKYFAPTLVESPQLESPLMQEEIFGPILPVFSYEKTEELFPFIAQFPEPLTLYIFTKNNDLEKELSQKVPYGGGCINNTLYHFGCLSLPFGGVGQSGMGAYHGEYGFNQLSHLKGILKSTFKPDLSLRYPPYGKKIGLLKTLLPWIS